MTSPLSVAVVAHVRHPIAPPFMGGMEAHSWHLVHALKARGHDVTLFASADSKVDVALHPILAEHYDRSHPWSRYRGTDELNAILDAGYGAALDALESGAFDVVHNNSLHRFPPRFARRDRVATVTSLHVPPFDVLHRAIHDSAAPWHAFTTTSEAQRRAWWPDAPPPLSRVVPNGIDLAEWPFAAAGDGSAVWSGRIMPLKGLHLAIGAVRRAGMSLRIFGAIEDREYFEEAIRPELGADIVYGGHLAQPDLAAEIGRAQAFLFTPLWDEPFGLAAVEAMACGVPVAYLDRGAAREVVGSAGIAAQEESPGALAQALRDAVRIPREQVRQRVEAKFGRDVMLDGYEHLYRAAMAARDDRWPEIAYSSIMLPAGSSCGRMAGAE
ncbi:glycosyltransferase involved in cell wall biosynthesis [Palleronia aestuarii]|uniref:Glycosyltransferase involved in cell wall biosynthesis n=1 Tax=Palleronia aestuarii TaxID=568105 RepID=A0A2W7NYE7_9RHOB|nr:glycosyltransferase [Palleronia aestuarii]PZX16222.1 glycosyltransferase involved in cell wall biosynthesis [Palleronia aestuarii]